MGEHPRFIIAFGILVLATCLIAIGLVVQTIALHPDAAGFLSIVTPAKAETEPSQSAPAINISNDPGGNVGEYYRKYKSYSDAGAEIHFHGMCASACTIVLFTEFTGIKACADDEALFGFHVPFEERNGKVIRTKSGVKAARELWGAWLEELPLPLRQYLKSARVPSAAEGDERNTMLVLPARLFLPRCPLSVAAQ